MTPGVSVEVRRPGVAETRSPTHYLLMWGEHTQIIIHDLRYEVPVQYVEYECILLST